MARSVQSTTTANPATVTVRRTARGWRLSQHGTVLSEVLARPGPTHSVFDVLAAACRCHPAPRSIALLGFGGGGVVAALRALEIDACVDAVDLDPTGLRLLRRSRAQWLEPLRWHPGDAIEWLRQSPRRYDVILDDLSVPLDGEVCKPATTWEVLPDLIADRLAPGGLAVFNLLRPIRRTWGWAMGRITKPFPQGAVIGMKCFENRIVTLAHRPLPPRELGRSLRETLRHLGSNQAGELRVSALSTPSEIPGGPG